MCDASLKVHVTLQRGFNMSQMKMISDLDVVYLEVLKEEPEVDSQMEVFQQGEIPVLVL